MKHKYNLKPNFIKKYNAAPLTVIPEVVDLESGFPPVFDQAQEGSCTGNGWAGMWAFFEILDQKKKTASPEEFSATGFVPASRQFIYYCERDREGTTGEDAGAQIETGAWVLSNIGTCDENSWPYLPTNWENKPSPAAYSEAASHKISNAFSLSSMDEIKHSLIEGYPVICGIEVFDNLESDEVAQTGILGMPNESNQSEGGHCVVIVGYDNTKNQFKIRNSWGSNWGINGYFVAPYEYIMGYGGDFMTLRR